MINNSSSLETSTLREKDKHPLIEQILEKSGYGFKTWLILISVFFTTLVDGVEMMLFASFIIPLRKFYNLSDLVVKLISSLLFIAVGMGSFSTGYITHKFGRLNTIRFAYLLITISHIFMALSYDIYTFAFFRIIVGMCIGILIPLSINVLSEYLPLRLRSFFLNVVWTGFTVGQIACLLLMLFIMPNMESDLTRLCILTISILNGIGYLVNLFCLEDSPRNLILQNNEDRAFEILSEMNKDELTHKEKTILRKQVFSGVNTEFNGDLVDLFSSKLIRTTIPLMSLWFINSFTTYGTAILVTLTLSQLNINQTKLSNHEVILQSIYMSLITMPSNLIGGLLTEISWLGRKKTIIFGYILAIVFFFLVCFFPSSFSIWFGLAVTFISISFSVGGSYSSEVYPTRVRDMALGVCFFSTRVGGFLSQFVYLIIFKINLFAPYYATIAVLGVGIVMTIFLPIETYNKPLDHDHSNDELGEEVKPLTTNNEENINIYDRNDTFPFDEKRISI
jgi:MFS family permease